MINIRSGVFETNSSSVHTITICLSSEYKDWQEGKVLLNKSYDKAFKFLGTFITPEVALKTLKNNDYINSSCTYEGDSYKIYRTLYSHGIYSVEAYLETDLETYSETYTTPNGEEIIAFGYFGEDN